MFKKKIYKAFPFELSDNLTSPFIENFGDAESTLEVNGIGEIQIRNTGGSSASEGGMGNDNEDDKAKGELSKIGGKAGENMTGDETEDDTSFDPIKKNVREAEKARDKE